MSREQERLEEKFLKASKHYDDLDRVKDCVSRGVNVEAQDKDSWRAIHLACYYGRFHIVRYLVEECHVDATAVLKDGRTALHAAACSYGCLTVVQYLIEDCQVDAAIVDNEGMTALHLASQHGQRRIVRYLLEECQVDATIRAKNGRTALHYACQHTDDDYITDSLIKYGRVDVAIKDNDGLTALHLATEKGHYIVVFTLIRRWCTNNSEFEAFYGLLLSDSEFILERYTDDVKTALHLAASNGHWRIVRFFVRECHVDATAADKNGMTALHFASRDGHLDIVQDLIRHYIVDATVKNNEGLTAFHLACMEGHLDVIRFFIQECQFYQFYNYGKE